MKNTYVVLVLFVLAAAVAWSSGDGESMEAARPQKLVIGFTALEESAEKYVSDMKPFEEYLEQELGMEIEWYQVTDHTTMVEGMRAKKVDMCTFSPFRYLVARQRVDIEPVAMPRMITADAGDELKTNYWSAIVVKSDAPFHSLDDVIADVGNLSLALEEPASTSGSLVPRGGFLARGVDVDESFKEVVATGSSVTVAVAVANGHIDVGGLGGSSLQRLVDKEFIEKDSLKVIWRSPDIPLSAVVMRSDLDESVMNSVKDAYANMGQEMAEFLVRKPGLWEYVSVTADEYGELIKDLRATAEKLGFLE